MKEDNIKEVICKYDSNADILGIKVNHDFTYGETIEMDDGLLLDFDIDNVPISLEVLDASWNSKPSFSITVFALPAQ